MKANELIIKLKKVIQEHGDIEVFKNTDYADEVETFDDIEVHIEQDEKGEIIKSIVI